MSKSTQLMSSLWSTNSLSRPGIKRLDLGMNRLKSFASSYILGLRA